MTTDKLTALSGGRSLRAALPMNRAQLRGLGLSVGIAIAVCGCDHSPEQRTQWVKERAQREARLDYKRVYDHCMYGVTGPFGSASYEVMKECERQARAASGMEAAPAAETTEIGSVHESPTANGGDAQGGSHDNR